MDSSSPIREFKKPIVALLIIGSVFLAAATIGVIKTWGDRDPSPAQNIITVMGKGEALAVPDIAVFSYSVVEDGKTVAEAQQKATDKSNKVLQYLKDQKIAEKDIKTVNYSINPRYDYIQVTCVRFPCPQTQKLAGYEVTQSVEVKVRDTAQAGTLLSGIGSQEVQNVSGINFQIDNEDKIKADARQKAIDDAKTQAQELARQLGVRLGAVVNFSESGTQPIYYARDAYKTANQSMAAGAPAPEIPTGENKITSNVTITYEIK